jgi:hypothetical protein
MLHLMARGVSGTSSESESRVLEFLADPDVNRRVFGQPLPGTVAYYLADYLCITRASGRFARNSKSSSPSNVV